ncbi:MAG: nucleoside recognition protein [Clostridiales bacterium]|nr:nucleoside recognition protein [Clostridiales bacterium]
MQEVLMIAKKGLLSGLKTLWTLAKVVAPVYFLVSLLELTGILAVLADWLQPFMALFGLPGQAALILVIGNFVNLFSAIGAMAAISLTPKEITIIASMLLISHSLIMEGAVVKKAGANPFFHTILRITLSALVGVIFNQLIK